MAARSRITVLLLLFLLSTEHSFAVTQKELTPLVKELLSKYSVEGMFSLAVSIPLNQNQNQNKNQNKNQDQNAFQIIKEVIGSDPANRVKEKINKGEVYIGERMIAAKVLMRKNGPGADHAESRVVDNLCNSPQVNKEDLLLLYVYASPCVEKCTNKSHPQNILRKINNIRRWKSYAVVFSKIFKPRKGPENTDKKSIEALIKARREALNQLATYKDKLGPIGLENIFRCDRKKTETNKKLTMQCISCSNKGQVVDECVSDDPPYADVNSGRGRRSNQRRVRRDISYNTGGSSSHISESNKGAEDAPSVDENGNNVTIGEVAESTTGESVSLSPTGSDDGNGSDLGMAEDISSPQIGFDSGVGNGKVSRGKGKVSKGKGGKGRRGKGKGRRGQGGKGKVSRGKGKVSKGKGGKGRRGKGKVSKGKGHIGRRGKGKGRRGQGGIRKVSRGKGKVSKGKGGKGRRGIGKGRRGKGGKGKGRRGKGKGRRGKGGKRKGSRRGGKSRRRGLDQEWIFDTDF